MQTKTYSFERKLENAVALVYVAMIRNTEGKVGITVNYDLFDSHCFRKGGSFIPVFTDDCLLWDLSSAFEGVSYQQVWELPKEELNHLLLREEAEKSTIRLGRYFKHPKSFQYEHPRSIQCLGWSVLVARGYGALTGNSEPFSPERVNPLCQQNLNWEYRRIADVDSSYSDNVTDFTQEEKNTLFPQINEEHFASSINLFVPEARELAEVTGLDVETKIKDLIDRFQRTFGKEYPYEI